jgi:hypothetical protein
MSSLNEKRLVTLMTPRRKQLPNSSLLAVQCCGVVDEAWSVLLQLFGVSAVLGGSAFLPSDRKSFASSRAPIFHSINISPLSLLHQSQLIAELSQ